MNQIPRFEERVQTGLWLMDLRSFNREAALSDAERRDLAWYVQLRQRWTAVPILEGMPPGLVRIQEPLESALRTIHASEERKARALFMLLERVNEKQALFWGWTETDWLGLLHDETRLAVRYQQRAIGLPLIAYAYLLTGFCAFPTIAFQPMPTWMATLIIGADCLQEAVDLLWGELHQSRPAPLANGFKILVSRLLLYSGSASIKQVTPEAAAYVLNHHGVRAYNYLARQISGALLSMGVLQQPAVCPDPPQPDRPRFPTPQPSQPGMKREKRAETAPAVWQQWCQRWQEASPLPAVTRGKRYKNLLRVGRWLQATHPEVISPEQWTRDLALDFVAAVCQWRGGDWALQPLVVGQGKPLSASTKIALIAETRAFFMDCQQWEWLPRRFDPLLCLRPPRSLKGQVQPRPEHKVIDAPVWARLIWAGLQLNEEDVAIYRSVLSFPYEMVKAMAFTWLFCGLRPNELQRLRLGCVRGAEPKKGEAAAGEICHLEVPPNKRQPAYSKPVDALVGEAIAAWEQVRPATAPLIDNYTEETIHYLFCYQGRVPGAKYCNEILIPFLCHQAGVPLEDSRGRITCARARTTIASPLANAENGMSVLALSRWLGHKTVQSTLHYVNDSSLTLTKAYSDAGYFGRNIRVVEVLIDREAVLSGATMAGAPWKYYDLGHGYCTYDFFDQCPHRMVCARCAFYQPKAAIAAQMDEARGNLLQMLEKIPLTDSEQEAVEDGLTAIARLYGRLADTPAPDGHTPYQAAVRPAIVSVDSITIHADEDGNR
ncbi:MAG: site-specific integrase [Anaerolineae bacterium]|nr:site-specific integrase [Anaerolineae bacterium]